MKIFKIILLICIYNTVYAFDCSKAKTETEKGICSNSNEILYVLNKGVNTNECDDSKVKKVIYSPRETGKIIGSGRVYFYKSPDEKCKALNLFLVPNDKVVIYESTEDSKFESIMFITKGGNAVTGWIDSKNIQHTGKLGQ